MLKDIKGLHHVTSLARDAKENNAFFTQTLGLRRVKKTVNFDAPEVYHLYYGDERGTPGSVMTYFPFPGIVRGRPGTGEVGTTVFSIPEGSIGFWKKRFIEQGVEGLKEAESFGQKRLEFAGPDGDGFALVEDPSDDREAWSDVIADDHAIRGFHSAAIRLRDPGAMAELLSFMGYEPVEKGEGVQRLHIPGGEVATTIDLETMPSISNSREGAGSVHHIAFAVENCEKQLQVRKALLDTGYAVTPVIDRDYFFSVYFRTPDGVLFEIATNEPGFARDEEMAHLGEGLKIPAQHEHLRPFLEAHLQQID